MDIRHITTNESLVSMREYVNVRIGNTVFNAAENNSSIVHKIKVFTGFNTKNKNNNLNENCYN